MTLRRRFTEHRPALTYVRELAPDDPAAVEGRSRYVANVVWPGFEPRMLKSGEHNRKIGSRVMKGRWAGMPIYTLTLEERATCPRSCRHWLDCFGNEMHWPPRLMPGRALEWRLGQEIRTLSERHPGGFVVRLHVLGDFYSVGYVRRWLGWLRRFPALRVYGYTAWLPDTAIGALIADARGRLWDRFAVRTSDTGGPRGTLSLYVDVDQGGDGETVVCPAQKDRTACCGTCAACWEADRAVAFLVH